MMALVPGHGGGQVAPVYDVRYAYVGKSWADLSMRADLVGEGTHGDLTCFVGDIPT